MISPMKGKGKGKTSPVIHKFRPMNWETMHLQNYERDIKNGLEKVLKIKKPAFHSDRSNFFVIMPNLNFSTQDGTQDGTQGNERVQLEDKLILMIRNNAKISIEKMSEAIGVSVRTIKRRIAEMPNVQFIGRGFSGHWEIKEDK